jgi:hypothetical protein
MKRLLSALQKSVRNPDRLEKISTRGEWVDRLTTGTIGMQNGTKAWYYFDGTDVHRLRMRWGTIKADSRVSKEELKKSIPIGENRYITTVDNIDGLPDNVIKTGRKFIITLLKNFGGLESFDEGLL